MYGKKMYGADILHTDRYVFFYRIQYNEFKKIS